MIEVNVHGLIKCIRCTAKSLLEHFKLWNTVNDREVGDNWLNGTSSNDLVILKLVVINLLPCSLASIKKEKNKL